MSEFTLLCYLALGLGASWWPDSSNQDGVEADRVPGIVGEVSAAACIDAGPAGVDAEVALGARGHQLHGQNGNGRIRSADGEWLIASQGSLHLWPRLDLGPIELYAGGGGGVTWARSLGDDAAAPHWRVGAGLRWRGLDLGWRYQRWRATLDGNRARYDAHGVLMRWRWH